MVNGLKNNGWFEVDVLDLKILYESMNNKVKRSEIKEKMDITREKARIRLERLSKKGIVDKIEKCRHCGEDISECTCGRYGKVIYYNRESDEEEVKEMKKFIQMVDNLGEEFDFSSV